MLEGKVKRKIRIINDVLYIAIPPDVGFTTNDIVEITQTNKNKICLERVERLKREIIGLKKQESKAD